jgi:hypothetical protein
MSSESSAFYCLCAITLFSQLIMYARYVNNHNVPLTGGVLSLLHLDTLARERCTPRKRSPFGSIDSMTRLLKFHSKSKGFPGGTPVMRLFPGSEVLHGHVLGWSSITITIWLLFRAVHK